MPVLRMLGSVQYHQAAGVARLRGRLRDELVRELEYRVGSRQSIRRCFGVWSLEELGEAQDVFARGIHDSDAEVIMPALFGANPTDLAPQRERGLRFIVNV